MHGVMYTILALWVLSKECLEVQSSHYILIAKKVLLR